MKVTFICHSGFAVELDECVLLFDYYGEGSLPDVPAHKQAYFLNSHRHPDHFRREILTLRDRYKNAEYILSRDIRLRPQECKEWIHSVKAGEEYGFGRLHIRTLRSTDTGVAFVVEAEGKRIYHAGDLNWWHWNGEGEAWNKNMEVNYKREIDRLEGMSFDAAFVPLDPRLGDAYDWGLNYFLEKTAAKHIFPMHFWGECGVCARVQNRSEKKGLLKNFRPIECQGQTWELCGPYPAQTGQEM